LDRDQDEERNTQGQGTAIVSILRVRVGLSPLILSPIQAHFAVPIALDNEFGGLLR
jgi:hypothetical protein